MCYYLQRRVAHLVNAVDSWQNEMTKRSAVLQQEIQALVVVTQISLDRSSRLAFDNLVQDILLLDAVFGGKIDLDIF